MEDDSQLNEGHMPYEVDVVCVGYVEYVECEVYEGEGSVYVVEHPELGDGEEQYVVFLEPWH